MTYEQRMAAALIAQEVIAELDGVEDRGPRELEYYKAHRDGACDFVYIEESVDAALTDKFGTSDLLEFTCGIVFGWLRASHGVQPPAWFKNWLDGYDRAAYGDGPTMSQRQAFLAKHDPARREEPAAPLS
jgi:hypothetical protein